MDYNAEALKLHEKNKGKIGIVSKVKLENKDDLSTAYTPGVAAPCLKIRDNIKDVYRYTIKGNTVAVVTDGSAVLGLGNIGAEASLPVMEGKCILFKRFANIDAFPIAVKSQDVSEIVDVVKNIAPVFGGINLEDISAPRCFEIEEKLQNIGIPVMHDDQHGTAVVVMAALINSAKVIGKGLSDLRVVINGAGAAGIAIARLLLCIDIDKGICSSINAPVKEITILDSMGIVYKGRKEGMNRYKKEIAGYTRQIKGNLDNAIKGADVFIGVSVPNVLNKEMVKSMGAKPIIFAMANPNPEISPKDALAGGASVVGTGRSDFPNQINNVLGFPGIFRGALDAKARRITGSMKMAAAVELANSVKNPRKDKVVPSVFDGVAYKVAEAVKRVKE